MGLSEEYRRQFRWRHWPAVLDRLPPLDEQRVLDLGCGVGDQAALLADRGASVLGLDSDEELLRTASSRGIPKAEFRAADLGDELELEQVVDGVWSSFGPAYFPDLAPALRRWTKPLRPGGWVLLVEIDDLFGHRPLPQRSAERLEAYAQESLRAVRYDFHMGRKLVEHLRGAGLLVQESFEVPDGELSFDGPADPDVLTAWSARLGRMRLLQRFFGEDFERLREDFLGGLASADHHSTAAVRCCLATAPEH